MKITNIKKGQTVYVLKVKLGNEVSFEIYKTQVMRAGRKYVYVSTDLGYEQEFYLEDSNVNYLEENEYRCNQIYLLFLTEKDANDHIALLQTREELKKLIRSPKLEEYSLDQLRLVNGILSIVIPDDKEESFKDIPVSSLAKTLACILPVTLRSELSDIMQYQNILEDIDAYCEDNDADYPQNIRQKAAIRYVFDGEHDSNLDHWTNLKRLLEKCSGE